MRRISKKNPRKIPPPEHQNIPLFGDQLNPSVPGASGSTATTGDPLSAVTGGTPGARDKSWNFFQEIGITGVQRAAGFIQEEFLPELQGSNGMKKFREMRDNSSEVGASVFAIEMPARQVTWRVEPANTSAEAKFKAKFIEECLDDMSTSWRDTLAECLSMIVYGFSYHELCYKIRGGRSPDKLYKSKYDDGLVGWGKLPIRAQETLFRWEIDAAGGIQGMWQLAAPDYRMRFIPIDKALLFRTTSFKNNPEGRSLLRSGYFSWYYLKKIVEYESIGIERDLAGIPVAYVPEEVAQGSNGPYAAQYANIQAIVRDLKNDEQAGLVIPSTRDEHGHPLYELELMSATGGRAHDTNAIIMRHSKNISSSLLSDFIQLGHSAVGSRALADPKIEFFILGVNALLDSICDVINTHAIPRLIRLNGWPEDDVPKLVHGEVRAPDLVQVGAYFQSLANAGMPLFPNTPLENFLLGLAKAPQVAVTGMTVPEPRTDFEEERALRSRTAGATDDSDPTAPQPTTITPESQAPAGTPAGLSVKRHREGSRAEYRASRTRRSQQRRAA